MFTSYFLFLVFVRTLVIGLDQWSGSAPTFSSIIDFDTLDMVGRLYSKQPFNAGEKAEKNVEWESSLTMKTNPHQTKWKCLGPLGCFHNGPPFYHPKFRPTSLLPYDRDRLATRFLLFTRNNTGQVQLLNWEQPQTLRKSFFDSQYKTKIIIHGLFDMLRIAPWIFGLKNELLLNGYFNVIVVDWTKGNRFPYEQAVANTRAVAVEVALAIKALEKHKGLKRKDVHIIGHSLGAHVAGYTGSLISGIGRISGLDPAGVYFNGSPKDVRLDSTDALFVDVIHTDASTFTPLGIGIVDHSGHVDFFVNGGTQQPGCLDDFRIETFLLLGLLPGSRTTVSCDHERSIDYYLESVNNNFCQPVGLLCNNYQHFEDGLCGDCGKDGSKCLTMGYHGDMSWNASNITIPRSYYLKTTSRSPFCVHQYHVTLEVDVNSSKVFGMIYLLVHHEEKMKIRLSRKSQKLIPGESYSYLIVSKHDLREVNVLQILWSDQKWHRNNWLLTKKITLIPIQVNDRKPIIFCGNMNERQVLKTENCLG